MMDKDAVTEHCESENCWCKPDVERYKHADVVIHQDVECTPMRRAMVVFDAYAAESDAGLVPSKMSQCQIRLAQWQNRNFGSTNTERLVLGVCEEAGELAHAVLKHGQRIRGMDDHDAYLEAAGDAVADCMVYLTQVATALRMDLATLYLATADKVMHRDWVKRQADADQT